MSFGSSGSGLRGLLLCIYLGFFCKSLASVSSCIQALATPDDLSANGGLAALLAFEIFNVCSKLVLIWCFHKIDAGRLRDLNLLIVCLEVRGTVMQPIHACNSEAILDDPEIGSCTLSPAMQMFDTVYRYSA